MAELEALAEIKAATAGHSVLPGQYAWRYPLPEKKTLRLGSDPSQCDWSVPEDRMISRFHATLEWDGSKLIVLRRGVSPEYPRPPQNHIWFRNNPVERCEVRPGEWFVIGQTRFAVRGDDEAAPASPVDASVVKMQVERTRDELERIPFPTLLGGAPLKLDGTDPDSVATTAGPLLKGVESLLNSMRVAPNEATLFRQVLRSAMTALPRADAACVVRVPSGSGGQPRVAVVEQQIRQSASQSGFTPSRKLVRRAVLEQKRSCLYIWSGDPTDLNTIVASEVEQAATSHMTVGAAFKPGQTPWAICTPFQDGTDFALYLGGVFRDVEGQRPPEEQLLPYQKYAEILVGMLENARQAFRLTRQNDLLQGAWPTALRRQLDDPDRLEAMLRPRETDVTVLFCDLRNYSGFAEEHGSDLTQAWAGIQAALDTMSGAITEKGGIVAGFRGDAVLGFWGWPDGTPDQVERAAAAALRIRERLGGWMLHRRCGLGLTHGRALAGRLGAHDLGVVDLYGPVVNLAFRLEEMTKAFGVNVIVSDVVAERLTTADPSGAEWRTRRLGKVRPRGMKTPLIAFELSPPAAVGGGPWITRKGYQSQLRLWDDAVNAFVSGEWERSREQLDSLFEGDPVAQCLLRHMDRTRGKAPPDWDGAFTPRPPE